MKKIFVILVLFFSSSVVASELSDCKKINDNVKRPACYESLFEKLTTSKDDQKKRKKYIKELSKKEKIFKKIDKSGDYLKVWIKCNFFKLVRREQQAFIELIDSYYNLDNNYKYIFIMDSKHPNTAMQPGGYKPQTGKLTLNYNRCY